MIGLIGTLTDGDLRRTLLAGLDLNLPVSKAFAQKRREGSAQSVTAPETMTMPALLELMHQHNVHQLPLVGSDGRIVDLVTINDLVPDLVLPLKAVVMAGGRGSRLRPVTEDIPKPMLLVGDKPLMQRTIERLQAAGIRRINVMTHYKPDAIMKHFGDGRRFGVAIDYVNEEMPLGTAGGLSLLEESSEPLLVINGDILTSLNYRAMLKFHQDHDAVMTVGVRQHEMTVPYGVIETDGVEIRCVNEKPAMRFFINAGVYLLQPEAFQYIPKGERFDMTELIARLIAEGKRVISFPITEYWLDIGQHVDYARAQEDARAHRFVL